MTVSSGGLCLDWPFAYHLLTTTYPIGLSILGDIESNMSCTKPHLLAVFQKVAVVITNSTST